MRPRPFKFFFGATIAVMAFFFLAKVFFIAFVVAGIMSLLFHLFRGIKYSLMDLNGGYRKEYRHHRRPSLEYSMQRNDFADDWNHPFEARQKERIIKVF